MIGFRVGRRSIYSVASSSSSFPRSVGFPARTVRGTLMAYFFSRGTTGRGQGGEREKKDGALYLIYVHNSGVIARAYLPSSVCVGYRV